MAHLPPVGWADVATKRDLDVLAERLEARMAGFEHQMEGLEHRMMATLHRELNHQMRTVVLALSASASVIMAAVGIAIVGG